MDFEGGRLRKSVRKTHKKKAPQKLGGVYHRKGNTIEKDDKSFLRNLVSLGWLKKSAMAKLKLEKTLPRKIGSVKANFEMSTHKRKPSEYNLFVGKVMRAGHTMKEASELWNSEKTGRRTKYTLKEIEKISRKKAPGQRYLKKVSF